MSKAAGVNVYYEVTDKIFSQLSHSVIWGPEGLSPLKRFKEGETSYIAACPNPRHQGARQTFIMPKAWPGGQCRMCGYREDWVAAAVKRAGGSFQDGLALLAEKAGVDLAGMEISVSDWDAMQSVWRKLFIFGLLSHYFSRALIKSEAPAAAAARSYFKELGITSRALTAFPIGFYTSAREIRQYLSNQGISQDDMDAAGIFSTGLESEYPFLYAFEDGRGNISGYTGADPQNPRDRLLMPGFTEDLQSISMFGLQQATPMIASERSVWLAETEQDTIIIQFESNKMFKIFKQMVSFGTGLKPTIEKLKALMHLGAEHFIYVTPLTAEGRKLTGEFALIIRKVGVKADVMPLPEGIDSLNSLVLERGYDYFDKSLVSKSGLYSIGRWLATELTTEYDISKESGLVEARRAAAETSLELAEEDAKEFVYAISEKIKWDPHFWCIVLEQYQGEQAGKALSERVKSLISQMERKRKDDAEMGFSWSINPEDLEEVAVVTVSEDELMRSFYNPREVLENFEATRPPLKTGLSELDRYISLRQGEMTLVSGWPGSGKTTLCIHLICKMLESQEDAVLFFSFENNRISVFNMLISNFYGIPHSQIVSKELESASSLYQKYLNAVEEFTRFRDKLVVIEEPFHSRYCASDIQEICQMVSENISVGLVLVDMLDMVSWDKTEPISNEVQQGSVAKDLLFAARRVNAPIVITTTPAANTASRRTGDFSGSILSVPPSVERYATIVVGLQVMSQLSGREVSVEGRQQDRLQITIQKNTLGRIPSSPIEVGFDPEHRRLVDLAR